MQLHRIALLMTIIFPTAIRLRHESKAMVAAVCWSFALLRVVANAQTDKNHYCNYAIGLECSCGSLRDLVLHRYSMSFECRYNLVSRVLLSFSFKTCGFLISLMFYTCCHVSVLKTRWPHSTFYHKHLDRRAHL